MKRREAGAKDAAAQKEEINFFIGMKFADLVPAGW
jgi:hypothetical protein